MNCGAVWLERGRGVQRLRRVKRALQPRDVLHLYYSSAVLDEKIEPPTLISDEGAYSVWYKPFGVRSQGSKWGDHCTVQRWAERHLQPQRTAFTVHRLDRAVTGLILVAHAKKTAASLSTLFQQRKIDKRYRTVVHGQVDLSVVTIDISIDGRDARSFAKVLERRQNRSLLDVSIGTGRKHQIRRHLAHLGHPVVGDRLYSSKDDEEDLQLTAYLLGFTCPETGEERRYVLPDEYLPRLLN